MLPLKQMHNYRGRKEQDLGGEKRYQKIRIIFLKAKEGFLQSWVRRKAKQLKMILDGVKRQKRQCQRQRTGIGRTGMNIPGWQQAELKQVCLDQTSGTHAPSSALAGSIFGILAVLVPAALRGICV